MKVIDFQIKRGAVLKNEVTKRRETLNAMNSGKGQPKGKKELEVEIKKYQNIIKKQDKLFCCMIFIY